MTNPDPVFGALGAALDAYVTSQAVMTAVAEDIAADSNDHNETAARNNKEE